MKCPARARRLQYVASARTGVYRLGFFVTTTGSRGPTSSTAASTGVLCCAPRARPSACLCGMKRARPRGAWFLPCSMASVGQPVGARTAAAVDLRINAFKRASCGLLLRVLGSRQNYWASKTRAIINPHVKKHAESSHAFSATPPGTLVHF